MQRWSVALLLAAIVGMVACNDESSSTSTSSSATTNAVTTNPPSSELQFGSATIEPAVAAAGDRVTITPSAEIQPICGGFGVVLSADERHDLVLQLADGRVILNDGATQLTWPACLPPRSSTAARYTIAADFPLGTYVVCLTDAFTEEGCATLTVVAPDTAVPSS